MLIRFTRDYRGKLTKEIFYVADTEVELDDGPAAQIIEQGAAVAVELPTEEQPGDDAPQPKRKRRKSTEE